MKKTLVILFSIFSLAAAGQQKDTLNKDIADSAILSSNDINRAFQKIVAAAKSELKISDYQHQFLINIIAKEMNAIIEEKLKKKPK